jgi:hypothetical protein
VTTNLDVEAVQLALDALISGDSQGAADHFADDLVMTGVGGRIAGRIVGLPAVLDRFAGIARDTGGTFGTEVEAVYSGDDTPDVVITRHWASIDGHPVQGTQALLVTSDRGRVHTIDALSRPGATSGVWD